MGSGDIIKVELIKVSVTLLQLIDINIFSICLNYWSFRTTNEIWRCNFKKSVDPFYWTLGLCPVLCKHIGECKKKKKKSVNLILSLWSLPSCRRAAIKEQCKTEDDGLHGTNDKGSKSLERNVVWIVWKTA